MDEAKVRAAAKVATELLRDTPIDIHREVWQSVFHALLSEPYGVCAKPPTYLKLKGKKIAK